MSVLSSSIDASEAFSRLGASMDTPDEMLQGLENFCVEVFGSQKDTYPENITLPVPILPEISAGLLSNNNSVQSIRYQSIAVSQAPQTDHEPPSVGTVLTVAPLQKQAPPEGFTADELSFGTLETATPLAGIVTSAYGYRHHPIDGSYRFHGGMDIGADLGTPIAAFADGQVEYIGENSSYGLYLQIDHGNEIKSFYAHCQQLCVAKGQQVRAGETVALVGSTGISTGPHLHLELKCGGIRVNPAYYLTTIHDAA